MYRLLCSVFVTAHNQRSPDGVIAKSLAKQLSYLFFYSISRLR